ncbi:uncharacterized protein LOC113234005 [Hyposmocoma kahamanoa]|uniref:uncharacterized protein LOC113234005 n=1 Tax=Hyposmocoma kahamanoa TaxID=1477025 RepID=UPI000E6D948C|nr:uncharacterized protein LOC113234005 [Hyposmocoma kahamanoa]
MDKAGPSSGKINIVIIEGNKGKGRLSNQGMVLLHAGHKYNFVKTNMCGTTNWRCVNKNICSTSITLTADNKEIVKEAKHVCLPDYERNKIDFTMSLAKQEVCLNMAPIPEIFEKHYYKLHKQDSDHTFGQGEMLSPEELPTFSSKKDTLYRARYKFLNVKKSKFLRPQDVQLPDSLVSDFFLYDDGVEEKIIIFGTRLAKATLKTVDIVYVDGTFRCCPIPFYQLFSVHADITHESGTVCFVPLLFALLPNKSQTTYERLFKILKYQFFMNISTFKCDYELAIIQAIKAIYPDIVVKGCYYHFTNAVWKKSKSINFSSSNEGRKCTQLFSLLALLPASLIPEAYLTLCELAPNTEEIFARLIDSGRSFHSLMLLIVKELEKYFEEWIGQFRERVEKERKVTAEPASHCRRNAKRIKQRKQQVEINGVEGTAEVQQSKDGVRISMSGMIILRLMLSQPTAFDEMERMFLLTSPTVNWLSSKTERVWKRRPDGNWPLATRFPLCLSAETIRITKGLRLGVPVCSPHPCPCGKDVSALDHHSLSCQLSVGRISWHATLNNIIRRALATVNVPAILEPSGMSPTDGKCPNGMTLIPWSMGWALVWNATSAYTLAPSRQTHLQEGWLRS